MIRTPLALAVALVSSVLLAAPAHAELTVTKDATDDGHLGTDFKKVTVDHTEKRVRLNTRVVNDSDGDHMPDEVWHLVDTEGDRAPEFLVFVVVHNEVDDHPGVSVSELDGWPKRKNPYVALRNAEQVSCGLHRARLKDHSRLLRTTIGRGCLSTGGDKPDRLRVNTFGTREDGSYADVVKGWKKYGKWVSDD